MRYLQSSSDESDDLGAANREAVAAVAQSVTQQTATEKGEAAKSKTTLGRDESRTEVIAGKKVFIAQTPKGIRR